MTDDISRLPRWAQNRIAQAEASVEYHKRRLNESLGEDGEGTDTIVYMGYKEPAHGLPNGTPIRFQLDHGVAEARVEDGRLSIHSAHGRLVLLPVVTNSIFVDVIPR